MIEVAPSHLRIVKTILRRRVPDCAVRVFGSRISGTAKSYSDLDLVIIGEKKLPRKILHSLQDDFEESDLPFRVDVIDWHAISPEFQAVINKGYENL